MKDGVCGRVIWKSPAQGLLFNSASKEQITSNKRGYDCDLHCGLRVVKHNEHSSPENKQNKTKTTYSVKSVLQIIILIYAWECGE